MLIQDWINDIKILLKIINKKAPIDWGFENYLNSNYAFLLCKATNTKAMNLAGINSSTLDPPGGVIIRDQNSDPTGVLKDLAMDLVQTIIPEESSEEMDRALDRAMDYALSLGITQVHDMGSWIDLETYRRNHEKGNLKIRIKIYPWDTNWRNIIQYVEDYGPGDDWLRWNGMKGICISIDFFRLVKLEAFIRIYCFISLCCLSTLTWAA